MIQNTEWFEDESFWITLYPFVFPNERFEIADFEVDCLLSLIDKPVSSALDLCCGPGRHAIALAKRGISVTAVDRTEKIIDIAREKARKERVKIEWLVEDIINFLKPDRYDLVLNLFTSFGYFEKWEDNIRVLQNIYTNIKPGGVFVLDMVSRNWLLSTANLMTSSISYDGAYVLRWHKILKSQDKVSHEWLLFNYGKKTTFTFNHFIFSGGELEEIILGIGFRDVRLFADFEGHNLENKSKRLIVLATK